MSAFTTPSRLVWSSYFTPPGPLFLRQQFRSRLLLPRFGSTPPAPVAAMRPSTPLSIVRRFVVDLVPYTSIASFRPRLNFSRSLFITLTLWFPSSAHWHRLVDRGGRGLRGRLWLPAHNDCSSSRVGSKEEPQW